VTRVHAIDMKTTEPRKVDYGLVDLGSFSRDHLVEYTGLWDGERFPDGRPRVPDAIIERIASVTLPQAWDVLEAEGYKHQYEGSWICTHPGLTLCGRAVTATFMPRRPDVWACQQQRAAKIGHVGDHVSWPIDTLTRGDVYVADVFGKLTNSGVIGDNLGSAVYANSGNGVVHDTTVRDIEGIQAIPNFPCFCRGWSPTTSSPSTTCMDLNCPTRIGQALVMPGDIVLGKGDGVVFIPPHLAQMVADALDAA
jgi:regulator of RNase E activity RraA